MLKLQDYFGRQSSGHVIGWRGGMNVGRMWAAVCGDGRCVTGLKTAVRETR